MILVVGDAMVDEYWSGEVSRISPEAPVPVVKVTGKETRNGAAKNVAENCSAMGANVLGLYSRSFDSDPIRKIRVVGRSQQVCRIDFDTPQQPIDVEKFKWLLPQASIVIFSDYAKGALANVYELITAARYAQKKILVDPKGNDYDKYRGAAVIKPNADEMREMVGGWSSEHKLEEKAQKLRTDLGLDAILLTRAAEGITLFDDSGANHIAAEAREVYDVTGAGDTAIAAFAVALERGLDYRTAAWHANRAAGVAVGRFGTAVVTQAEVFE